MLEFTEDAASRIARLSICRAEKKNAMSEAMWRTLLQHCEALSARAREGQAPRVLLLQGHPGVFCAGADIEEMQGLARNPPLMAANNQLVTLAQQALHHLPLATVAVIDGPCFGGGFGLASACDFRLGSTRARLAIPPARLGLVYCIEDTRRVVALVGAARARRLLMRAEQLDASTALAWGALDVVVAPEELPALAQTWASELAALSPTALAGAKQTLQFITGEGRLSEDEVRLRYDAAFGGPDFAEGMAAFLAKRLPQF
jgi:enoyl-CoA hydratase